MREYGGSPGIRDEGLIESALARPRQKWAYEKGVHLALLAAAYAFGLVQNHGYVDGNKRVGAAAMGIFLNLNGFEVEAPEPELVAAMLAVASSEWDEGTVAGWLRERIVSFAEDEATEDGTD